MSAWFLFYIGALFILQEWRVKFIKKYENEAYYRNFLDIRFVLLGLLINHYYKKKRFCLNGSCLSFMKKSEFSKNGSEYLDKSIRMQKMIMGNEKLFYIVLHPVFKGLKFFHLIIFQINRCRTSKNGNTDF